MYAVFRTNRTDEVDSDEYKIKPDSRSAKALFEKWTTEDSTYCAGFGPIKISQYWQTSKSNINAKESLWFSILRVSEKDGQEFFQYHIEESFNSAKKNHKAALNHDQTLFCGIVALEDSTDWQHYPTPRPH